MAVSPPPGSPPPGSPPSPDVIVIGGGIAGLSVAYHLAGDCRVRLLEAEPVVAAHSSGRNAAMYRPLEMDETTTQLARRSRALIEELVPGGVLDGSGMLLSAVDPSRLDALREQAVARGVAHEDMGPDALARLDGRLAHGTLQRGLLLPEGGVLDIHAMTTALARAARARGATLQTARAVRGLTAARGRVSGVQLADGARVPAGSVVIAAGAWSRRLGEGIHAPLPLTPIRRHLFHLQAERARGPIVWCVDDQAYFRDEVSGVLASPCDETPWAPCSPPVDPDAGAWLAEKLTRVAPGLRTAEVRSVWACLRTFALDRELVAGPDPRVAGLLWLTGLGGRGMSVGPAAGELVARALQGDADALLPHVRPDRLIGGGVLD